MRRFLNWIADSMIENRRLRKRVDELLASNNYHLELSRDSRRRELQARTDWQLATEELDRLRAQLRNQHLSRYGLW